MASPPPKRSRAYNGFLIRCPNSYCTGVFRSPAAFARHIHTSPYCIRTEDRARAARLHARGSSTQYEPWTTSSNNDGDADDDDDSLADLPPLTGPDDSSDDESDDDDDPPYFGISGRHSIPPLKPREDSSDDESDEESDDDDDDDDDQSSDTSESLDELVESERHQMFNLPNGHGSKTRSNNCC